MSSTNRGYKRHKSDYYITPQPYIRTLLGEFFEIENIDNPEDLIWLDPCAGGEVKDDIIIDEMSYPAVLKEWGVFPKTIDIRKSSLAEIKGNYLEIELEEKPHIIISNPPFLQEVLQPFIRKAIEDVKDGGYVIMLLRINFLGSRGRSLKDENKKGYKGFWLDMFPELKYVLIHPDRMSFTKDGKTDSVEYCHMIWQKGHDNGGFYKGKITGFST